jgi:hypothetical protein
MITGGPGKQEVGMREATVGSRSKVLIVGTDTNGLCPAQGLMTYGISFVHQSRPY